MSDHPPDDEAPPGGAVPDPHASGAEDHPPRVPSQRAEPSWWSQWAPATTETATEPRPSGDPLPPGGQVYSDPIPVGSSLAAGPGAAATRREPVVVVPTGTAHRPQSAGLRSVPAEPPRRGPITVGPRLRDRAGPFRRVRSFLALLVIAVIAGSLGAAVLGLIIWGISVGIHSASSA